MKGVEIKQKLHSLFFFFSGRLFWPGYIKLGFFVELKLKPSLKPDLCSCGSQAFLGYLTSFRSQAELSTDIQLAFKPEPDSDLICHWAKLSQASSDYFNRAGSSFIKLKLSSACNSPFFKAQTKPKHVTPSGGWTFS